MLLFFTLFFSLTHHFLFSIHITCFSVSVSHLLSFISPAPVLSYVLSVALFFFFFTFTPSNLISRSSTSRMQQILLSQQRCQRMPRPPPQSDTSCHYIAPRVPCDTGRRGWMPWELIKVGGGRSLQPTWQNTSVGGTRACVCVLCMDDIPHSLRGQMSAVWTEW